MENQQIKIELIYDQQTKRITVNGQIMDPPVTLGILELAKQAVNDMYAGLRNAAIAKANEAKK